MVSSVQNHTKVPSFCSRSTSSAKTVELEWNGSKYEAVLTDSNKVLNNYSFKANISGVKFAKSGNTLTVSMKEAPTETLTSNVIVLLLPSKTEFVSEIGVQ